MNAIIQHLAAPLRQQVVQQLRQDILDGTLTPGQRLRETLLCERYGVSRTVVREALRQLESESLITMLPNRGPIVTVLTERDIRALYEFRTALEGLAGELFARNASDQEAQELISLIGEMESSYVHGDLASRGAAKDQFYDVLLRGADNPVLDAALRGVHSRIGIFRHYAFVDEQRVAASMVELRRIVDAAARRRDPALAREYCEDHIRLAGQLAVAEYTSRSRMTDAATSALSS